jgi:hypothetical protein
MLEKKSSFVIISQFAIAFEKKCNSVSQLSLANAHMI